MDSLKELGAEAREELTRDILPFSMRYVVDRKHGGFYGHVANDRSVQREAPKALVQHSRMLWTFVHAGRVLGDPQYLPVAVHARKALMDWFWDAEHRGFFWMVDFRGQPLQTDKLVYGQAFSIYALAEDHLASGHVQSLERAIELFRLLEGHCRDAEFGGYYEACHADWTPASDLRVDTTSLPVAKGMNVHLHMLEAYAHLLRAWSDDGLWDSLRAVIQLILGHILTPTTHQLRPFFDRQWRALSDSVSYGHDIEASWLLVEAAGVLGDAYLLARVREEALQMAYTTLAQGVDVDGGLFSEGDPAGVTDRSKVWWPQAEAVVGFLNAYQLNGDPAFLDACLASWRFIEEHIVDKEYGEWFWGLDEAGRPLDREKAGPWKAAYHNGRACMEVMGRVRSRVVGSARE